MFMFTLNILSIFKIDNVKKHIFKKQIKNASLKFPPPPPTHYFQPTIKTVKFSSTVGDNCNKSPK